MYTIQINIDGQWKLLWRWVDDSAVMYLHRETAEIELEEHIRNLEDAGFSPDRADFRIVEA